MVQNVKSSLRFKQTHNIKKTVFFFPKNTAVWDVVVCDVETSRIRRPWPALGCCAQRENTCFLFLQVQATQLRNYVIGPCDLHDSRFRTVHPSTVGLHRATLPRDAASSTADTAGTPQSDCGFQSPCRTSLQKHYYHRSSSRNSSSSCSSSGGYAAAQLVQALRYKPEGRGFDSRWSH